jgi:phenylpropionate dioxygenase-like ring-hydroxylating dioxygenase large terminal subunit
MWYYAVPSESLKKGAMVGKSMLGKPVLVGRRSDGQVFALEDICPHQAVPLSRGRFDGKDVECRFHGWKFDSSGACTEIPSLVNDQCFNLCGVKTATYPCVEDRGGVWVYFGNKPNELPAVPRAPGLDGLSYDKTTTTLILPNHIDYNVAALIDTAHVPFVHNSWWWRSARNLREKVKTYLPDGTGWTIARHNPSKHSIYKLIGDWVEDEISFHLPACRLEQIIFKGKPIISGITALTPIDEHTTELNHTTYWTVPYIAPLVTPFVRYFVHAFLSQDREMALLQEKCLKLNPKLIMTIKDAGTPGRWYFDLKKAWNKAAATDQPFVNPVKETELRWRS